MTGAERRATLLDAHEELIAALALAGRSLDEQADDPDFLALEDELFWSAERVRRDYSDLLSPVAISRCPFTNEVLRASIDTHDLDGLWWNYLSPLRRSDPRPPTLVALTGALALTTAPTWTPFLVKPGPGVPYVIPRLLAADEVLTDEAEDEEVLTLEEKLPTLDEGAEEALLEDTVELALDALDEVEVLAALAGWGAARRR